MTDVQTIDYFADPSLIEDPYPYFDALRGECPVLALPHLGVVAVTGYDAAMEIYKDTENFSSCNSVIGPFVQFPVPLEGDDISGIVAAHRHAIPMNEHMVTMDPPQHTRERGLTMKLITPKRLKENEDFVEQQADAMLDALLPLGGCEYIKEFSQPFAMLVIADLLGVPAEDHEEFRKGFGVNSTPGAVGVSGYEGGEGEGGALNALAWCDERFTVYVEDRRANPRKDYLTDLALATYPDGSTPEVTAVVRSATFLFAAGQETTARLLASAMKHLAEHPDVQDALRADRSRIPEFIEEVLRLESPVKTDFRLALRTTTIGDLEVKAGTPVMLLNGAANRDPEQFECPAELRLGRENVRNHIAFGRGVHSCPGGPLARVEGRIAIDRILDRTRNIRLSEEHHGPADDRRFTYAPTWILRGLVDLHIEWDPA
ncbi:MAG TPA: cytochrome P450 [Mycobacteriales bacterium]|nr:cytochrome P450 [Mycobacteriales bacterium]